MAFGFLKPLVLEHEIEVEDLAEQLIAWGRWDKIFELIKLLEQGHGGVEFTEGLYEHFGKVIKDTYGEETK